MNHIKKIIGANLSTLRVQMGLTLQQLSDVTTVSKAMLSGIEKGEMNPSITTLWKIADGLKIPITKLLNEKKQPVDLVRGSDLETFDVGEGYHVKNIFPFDPQKHIEVYVKSIEPGKCLESEGHREGIEEYIMVFEGQLEIIIGETMYQLSLGDSMKFKANCPHSYKNIGDSILKAYSVIYYEETI